MEINNTNQEAPDQLGQEPTEQTVKQKGYFLPIILVLLVLFILGAGAYYLVKSQSKSSSTTQIPPANTQNEYVDYTIPVVKEYNPSTFGRNLWLYSSDGLKSKQITKNHEIGGVYGFSPDKKRILVGTTKLLTDEKKVESYIGFVNLENGQVTKLFPNSNATNSIYHADWIDNDRIIYSIGRKLQIYNISSNSSEVLIDADRTITDATVIRFKVSPNKQWLVYNYEGSGEGDPPQQDGNTYSFNLNSKTQKQLSSGAFRYRELNNNYVIYTKNADREAGTTLWRINYDGSQDQQITKTPPEDLIEVISTDMGDKIIYQVRNFTNESQGVQLHLYETETKQDSIFFEVKVPDGIRDPMILDTEDSVLFSAALDENQPLKFSLILYNLKSNIKTILSENALK